MKCPNCNAENERNAVHCVSCGESLNNFENNANKFKEESKKKSEKKKSNADASSDTETDYTPKAPKDKQLAEIEKRRLEKKKRKQRNKIIGIVVAILILGSAIGYGAYWISENMANNGDILSNSTPTPIVTPAATVLPTESAMPTTTASGYPTLTTDSSWVTAIPSTAPSASKQTTKTTATKGTATNKTSSAAKSNSSTNTTAKATTNTTSKSTTSTTSTAKKSTTKAPTVTATANTSPGFKAGSVASTVITQGSNMNSQLVKAVGSDVDKATGLEVMELRIGNTAYYAYNRGQFTNGAKGYYSVDGAPSGNLYNGVPIYDMSKVIVYNANDYIIPYSAVTLVTENDVKDLTKNQLDIARNEIYARHGRIFKKQELQEYFNSKSWYKVNNSYNYSNDDLNLNNIEKANAKFLLNYAANK